MKISNTIILQKDVMESYGNTKPNPAVKGKKKNPGRVLKIALS